MKPPALPCATQRRDRDAGFLLTETLATFTISACVLLGLVSASSVLLQAVDRSVAHVQNVDDLGRTMHAITRDVSGLARARWNGYEPQPFVFQGGPNSLFFARIQRDPNGFNEIHVISLREITNRTGKHLMRGDAKLSSKAAGFDDLTFGAQRELGTGAARLRFSYIEAGADNGETRRVPAWPVGVTLPAAIIVEAIERDTGRVMISTRVPIRSNADIGCLEQASSQGDTGTSTTLSALNGPTRNAGDPPPTSGAAPNAAPTSPALSNVAGSSNEDSHFCGRMDDTKQKNAGTTKPAPRSPSEQTL